MQGKYQPLLLVTFFVSSAVVQNAWLPQSRLSESLVPFLK